jgi:hypothetical protein
LEFLSILESSSGASLVGTVANSVAQKKQENQPVQQQQQQQQQTLIKKRIDFSRLFDDKQSK